MLRHPLTMVFGLAILATGLALALPSWLGTSAPVQAPQGASRLVSLTPSVTETLVALGATDRLVGRSDYCHTTSPVEDIPMVGTSMQANLEALVRLKPDHILAANTLTLPSDALSQLAPTTSYPWRSAADLAQSVLKLGALVDKEDEAKALAERFTRELDVSPPREGPRVLLALDMGQATNGQLWYIKRNSLHGQALHAAGAINAVNEDITGAPSMPIEALLTRDPDMVILLSAKDGLSEAELSERAASFRRITALRASKNEQVGVLSGAKIFSEGPAVLDLVKTLRAEIERLASRRP